MKEENIVPAGEIVVDAADAPIDEELLVLGKKEEKVVNKAAKKAGKSTIKGLLFKNVAVVYKDEINAVHRERIDLSIPAVEPSWYQPAIRKKLSLWLDEQNILPTMIMQVALPSSGGKEFDMEARFLDVPIDEFTKEDVVNAAIYHRCRTVKSALGFDEEEMRHSLFMYLHNLDKIETGEDFTPVPYDPSYKVPAK
jgi:hypothetical protein